MKRFLGNASLSLKIGIAPLVVVLFMCVVSGVAVVSTLRTRTVVQDLAQSKMPGITMTGQISERVSHLHSLYMQSIAWEGVGLRPETIAAHDRKLMAELDAVALNIEQLPRSVPAPDARVVAHYRAVADAFAVYRQSVIDTLDLKSTLLATAAQMMTRSESSYADLRHSLSQIGAAQVKAGESQAGDVAQAVSATLSLVLGLTLLALVLSIAATWWIARLVSRPLQRAVGVARTVASGDLTARIEATTHDEAGQLMTALRDMNHSLAQVVEGVRWGSESIATGISEIAQGNADLSRRTEHQASSLQQTAAAMEQLSVTVKTSSERAGMAAQLMARTSHVAQRGGQVVGEVVNTMNDIRTASGRIADITSVIDGIAFQTNILALNAAVEAAAAGEQGRGFAVVAGEVRSLAQHSASAAREIKELIAANMAMVESGQAWVDQAGATMGEVVNEVQRVTTLIAEIDAATHEQTRGIEEVCHAVVLLDQVTQQNAALVEQSAAASESLRLQAQRLVAAVGHFKTH